MGSDDTDPARATNVASSEVAGSLVQLGAVRGNVYIGQSALTALTLPYRTASMPQRAAGFQPRVVIDELERVLAYGETAVLTSGALVGTGVVTGLGGVGKTQVALDYAERAWANGRLDLLVWVSASSREAIVSSYHRLIAGLTGFADPDSENGARRLLEWLTTATSRWLIVLDDLQHPQDLAQLWPPATPTGRVVVTTRRRDAALPGLVAIKSCRRFYC